MKATKCDCARHTGASGSRHNGQYDIGERHRQTGSSGRNSARRRDSHRTQRLSGDRIAPGNAAGSFLHSEGAGEGRETDMGHPHAGVGGKLGVVLWDGTKTCMEIDHVSVIPFWFCIYLTKVHIHQSSSQSTMKLPVLQLTDGHSDPYATPETEHSHRTVQQVHGCAHTMFFHRDDRAVP